MNNSQQESATIQNGQENQDNNVDPRIQAAHQAYRAQSSTAPNEAPAEPDTDAEDEPNPLESSAQEEAQTESEEPAAEPEAPVTSPTEALEFEVAELKSQLLRALADNDNLHKRAAREKEEASRYAIRKFAESMVGVAENLIRAMQSVSEEAKAQSPEMQTLVEGITMTASELEKALQAHGITRLFPEPGTAFDHHQHQAISQIPSPDHEAGTIVQTVQAGYQMHDRLLQPAMVVVAK